MKILNNISDLNNYLDRIRAEGQKIALIPTMGALHDGHLKLIEKALEVADIALPYIFVNPTQFAPGEDLEAYPRTLKADTDKLKEVGAQALWLPQTNEVYPNGLETTIHVDGISEVLEGAHRPHFFDGVASVVARMLNLSKPDMAIFGEKDFQQLQVIKQMVLDQNIATKIIGVETIRDKNGLALSSRNAYLNETDYEIAIELNHVLVQFAQNMVSEKEAKSLLLDMGFDKIDYITQRNSETFQTENPNRVLAAAWIGDTRLIDNMPMSL